jgi:hypothetical protein
MPGSARVGNKNNNLNTAAYKSTNNYDLSTPGFPRCGREARSGLSQQVTGNTTGRNAFNITKRTNWINSTAQNSQ